METRLDRIHKATERLEAIGIPANQWRIDTAKHGTGFPRLYVPVAYRPYAYANTPAMAREISGSGASYYCGYIYG